MTTTRLPGLGVKGTDQAAPPAHRRAAVIVAAAVLLVAVVVVWVVGFSSVLGVKTVTVRGETAGSADRIRAAAHIAAGAPLLRLDTEALARRVEKLPEIASASVHTAYPNAVVITVVERVAVGYVETGARFTLVDRTGDQFGSVAVRPRAIPLFALPDGPAARTSGAAVASVAAALPSILLSRVASIQAFDPNAITLLLTDHRVVSWGSAADAGENAAKARILPTLLTQPGTRFDVSDPTQVVAH
jgi:cell division protein FtsQ